MFSGGNVYIRLNLVLPQQAWGACWHLNWTLENVSRVYRPSKDSPYSASHLSPLHMWGTLSTMKCMVCAGEDCQQELRRYGMQFVWLGLRPMNRIHEKAEWPFYCRRPTKFYRISKMGELLEWRIDQIPVLGEQCSPEFFIGLWKFAKIWKIQIKQGYSVTIFSFCGKKNLQILKKTLNFSLSCLTLILLC
jgi:hypothetical protein